MVARYGESVSVDTTARMTAVLTFYVDPAEAERASLAAAKAGIVFLVSAPTDRDVDELARIDQVMAQGRMAVRLVRVVGEG